MDSVCSASSASSSSAAGSASSVAVNPVSSGTCVVVTGWHVLLTSSSSAFKASIFFSSFSIFSSLMVHHSFFGLDFFLGWGGFFGGGVSSGFGACVFSGGGGEGISVGVTSSVGSLCSVSAAISSGGIGGAVSGGGGGGAAALGLNALLSSLRMSPMGTWMLSMYSLSFLGVSGSPFSLMPSFLFM